MRLFFAVQIPLEMRKQVLKDIKFLCSTQLLKGISWVKEEQIHLTLRFLGECAPEELSKLEKAGNLVANCFSPFTITTTSFGVFPAKFNPRVLWLGLAQSKELINMVNRLNEELLISGYPKEERPFQAHLTIGRIKKTNLSPRNVQVAVEEILKFKMMELFMPVAGFYIIESKLTPGGAIHTILNEFSFK